MQHRFISTENAQDLLVAKTRRDWFKVENMPVADLLCQNCQGGLIEWVCTIDNVVNNVIALTGKI